jgi:hypothetical protein
VSRYGEQIARELARYFDYGEPGPWCWNTAEALLPAVERIAKERAAAEIRAIAHRLDDGGDEAIEVALGGAAYVHRVLCDCAHALDGKP